MTRINALTTIVLISLVAALLGGCVTRARVNTETEAIYQKLNAVDEHAFICAPKAYAMTRANADFARWEAMQGDSYRAKKHLERTHLWMKQVMTEAFNPDGSFKPGCEGDQDHDGVLNSQDKCPLIPEDKDGFEDTDGCPEPDNDLDGIPDTKDKCPNQPEDFDEFEDTDGCPEIDNDKDGIPDTKDKCPNQPEDFDGDQDDDGCPDLYKNIIIKDKKIELKQKIFFAFNKAKILSKSFEMLNEVGAAMKDKPEIRVRIEGHTDSKGSDRYNKKLSEQRAKSVRMYLIKQGVDPTHMVSIGYGEERPIADNDTEEGREMNRRVEFYILGNESTP